MKKSKKVFIIIPAYNEEKVIGSVIRSIKKEGYSNIVVVDDGSDDRTFLRAKEEGAVVLRHILNRGKGAAVKTGIEYAKLKNADVVVTIDGDGQHNPKDIKRLVFALDKNTDVVLGSRFLRKKNRLPLFNLFANFLANILVWFVYGVYVSDSQSGFRAYNKKALSLMEIASDNYDLESRIIYEISRHNLSYKEVPIDVFYTPYSLSKKQRQNLINGIKTFLKIIAS